tara:strand:+ start:1639 stop:2682 length:1044 start_codon:yes stop_codon:yes gene_type:complete
MNQKFSDSVIAWYKLNGRRNLPWKVNDPYKIWISEIMLQQTQVKTVIPYYLNFIKKFPDIKSLSKAKLDDLMLLWSGLGYYRRVKNIYLSTQIISTKYKNIFPSNYEEILSLPGIGRTTASAIATFSGYSNLAILDGNVKRILMRFFNKTKQNSSSKFDNELWEKSVYVTPIENTANFNQGMMDIGSLICTRNNPSCSLCPLKKIGCLYNPSEIKKNVMKKELQNVDMNLLVLINSKKEIYLEKINKGKLWEGLYSSPFFMVNSDKKKWESSKNLTCKKPNRVVSIRHRVTNKRIKINTEFYFLKNDKKVSLSSKNWYNLANIKVGVPKYQEKILDIYRSEYENSNV